MELPKYCDVGKFIMNILKLTQLYSEVILNRGARVHSAHLALDCFFGEMATSTRLFITSET